MSKNSTAPVTHLNSEMEEMTGSVLAGLYPDKAEAILEALRKRKEAKDCLAQIKLDRQDPVFAKLEAADKKVADLNRQFHDVYVAEIVAFKKSAEFEGLVEIVNDKAHLEGHVQKACMVQAEKKHAELYAELVAATKEQRKIAAQVKEFEAFAAQYRADAEKLFNESGPVLATIGFQYKRSK